MAPRSVIPIDQNWEFKQADRKDDTYLSVAQFPTQVHLDLLHHGLIPDPNIGKNELDVQWVGEKSWVYRTTFASPATAEGAKAVLAFDGLDTFATVVLNGKQILESENMFVAERVDVTRHLAPAGAANELVITFDCAYARGWQLVEEHPEHKWPSNVDDMTTASRLGVRKAQYHWGWDWGPVLLTCGPWRPVNLEIFESRLTDLWFDTNVDRSLKSTEVKTYASIEGKTGKIRFDVSLHGKTVASQEVEGTDATFQVKDPQLWYPARYGKQPLYTVTATLLDDGGEALDVMTKKIGLRRAELVQRPLEGQPGASFFFEVNGTPIFCGGSDWIPADSFIPRISPERYRSWLKLAADGNQSMIRVWGGGVYEEQAFYDACDELGLLVWHDFMFACGNYPAWPGFLAAVRREAEYNVKRLRHHPSIVIWAGNNEDYQVVEAEGLKWDRDDLNPDNWLKTEFPARYIYEKILPDVCVELIPSVYYHPSSPWGGKTTSDPTVGDIHQWNVWHGTQEKYQNFDKLVGRFVSEFGMEALPSAMTVYDAFLPQGLSDPDRYAQSATLDFRNKAAGQERRLALYLAENIPYAPAPLPRYVYATQLVQAECLASAYRLWRRQWRGPGREYCGGALVWQLNDCWPVTSWAVVDYYRRPKAAYYAVKRELAPVTVGLARRQHVVRRGAPHTRVDVETRVSLEVWASNLTLADLDGVDCVVKAWDVETGAPTYAATVAAGLVLAANRSTEIAELDDVLSAPGDAGRTVVAAYLVRHGGGEQIARYVNWPEPLKYLHLPKPRDLKLDTREAGKVSVSADVPVKGLVLEAWDDDVRWEDNCVDLVPGEVVALGVRAPKGIDSLLPQYLETVLG